MKVLFAASEASPFARTGGLGEVVGSLPKALNRLGADARVIIPKYGTIAAEYKKNMKNIGNVTVPVAWRRQYCGVEKLEREEATYYFLDNEYYFNRENIYGYYDEAERFSFFCRGVVETLKILDFSPEIIHCHDWQAALIPLFWREFCSGQQGHAPVKTVFTIHNLKYQGVFTHWILHNILGLGDEYFTPDRLEYYGKVNILKAGIVFSNSLTTVSRTYAEEIKYPFFGEGLDGLIRAHEHKLRGILNGLDYNDYDPEMDYNIYVNYNQNPDFKQENKAKLQEELALPVNKNIPLLGVVTRLTVQKGLDLLIHILDELLELDVQLVVLGAGEEKYEQFFSEKASCCPQKCRTVLKFDEVLARKIYAASDLFLMPSLFEPCGLSQLIALRYGALPVVRETGGLKDTVRPYNEKTGEGNGFTFANYNAHELLFTIKRALLLYRERETWNRLVANALQSDYSWEKSAREYYSLYRELAAKPVLKEGAVV
ncbi:MAG: glycogen synthase GlgA [Peptococcaceae bacterium]|nr:glycogen synthase GlgA [Peptococcaceae bacterium]MDH7524696.1 glycogen synthase GlgA [Peptococcaceae bacterium]